MANTYKEFKDLGYDLNESGVVLRKDGKPLKLFYCGSGYIQANVTKNNKTKSFLLHRLLAEKYIPNPEHKKEVNHRDGNKLNNTLSNLEWVTRSENIRHGIKNGLIPAPWLNKFGVNHVRSKRVYQFDKNMNLVNEFGSAREASRETGISYGTISNVLIGRGKTANGYYFSYININNKPV